MAFIPTTKKEMIDLGIKQFDYVCITGDAYVDHPSFGIAIISRIIESLGYTVGIISQPNWKDKNSFLKLGVPKYAFMVTSGNIDSMINHYSVAKNRRKSDSYSPGGAPNKRPDRAVTVYCEIIRSLCKDIPIVIGGIESSLRRFAHYDYWSDSVMPSILCDCKADLLVYGMAEKQIKEICTRFYNGESIYDMRDIRGTCYLTEPVNTPWGSAECPSLKMISENKEDYAKACRIQITEQDEVIGKKIVQRHGDKMLVQNEPAKILTREEFDAIYELPFERRWHSDYDSVGGVPAIEEVEFSITHNRGCYGNCNFCAISLHQGKRVASRSHESVLKEAEILTESKRFKGYIHDIGGPSANFREISCKKQVEHGMCKVKKCLSPEPCKQLIVDHSDYLSLLRKVRSIKKVKKVFIRSGIRYDYVLADDNDEFLREVIEHHVSGQLKVAPEHCSDRVLAAMGKPSMKVYKKFSDKFYHLTKKAGKEQYLIPYLMSSHPESTINDAVELALFLKLNDIRPEQVQDFYPTPGTVSTCMFYTGMDPFTMKKVYVPRTKEEKAMQRALLQYFNPKNKEIIISALKKAGRFDLIGNKDKCLVQCSTNSMPTYFDSSEKSNKMENKKTPRYAKSKNRIKKK